MDLTTIIDLKSGKNPTIETYHELELAYVFFNERLFDSQLPSCLITLQREKRTLGYHSHGRFVNADGEKIDELALNPSYFGVRSIKQTLSTLVHEQAHAVMHVLGHEYRRGYHCKRWGKIMKEIGLYPSNTGKYGGKETGQQMSHYIVQGGPFDKACDELLSNEFKFSWFDRYPPCSPMDVDVPLPASFLVSTVAILPKQPPKPKFLDDDDVEDVVELISIDLSDDPSRVKKILGLEDDYLEDDEDLNEGNNGDLDGPEDGASPVAKLCVNKPNSDVLVSDIGTILEDNEDSTIIEVADEGITGVDVELLNKPIVENHSNRVKYKCSNCSAQAWGKPKLKLKCGEEGCSDIMLIVAE